MTYLEFDEIVKANGLYQNGMSTYGEWGGYPFSMAKTKQQTGSYYSPEIIKFNFFTTGALPKEVIKEITKQYKKQGLMIITPKEGNIVATVAYKKKEDTQMGTEILNALTNAMRANGVMIKETCTVCGAGDCDCIVPKGELYVPAHRTCIEGKVNEAKVKTDNNLTTGSYVSGIIGAIVGAVIGGLPTIASAYFINTYFSIAFMLIPIAAYYGYKWFKGKMTNAVRWIICAVSFLQIPVIYVGIVYFAIKREGYALTLWRAAVLTIEMAIDVPGIFLGDLAPMIIFLVIGIVSTFGLISRTDTQEYTEQVGQLSMAVPMNEAKKITVPPAFTMEDMSSPVL